MGRIREAIGAANSEGRAALLIYLPVGYPDLATSEECLVAAAEAGADVLEVGFPFSDPIMDGPTIQAATQAALDQGVRVADDLALSERVTKRVDVPALVMTYYTIPDVRGITTFAAEAVGAGLSGAILPDLPADEADPWLGAAAEAGLETVFLAAATSDDARLDAIARASTGFVYATGLLGVTGVKDVDAGTAALVERIRRHTDGPVCVGVGVKTPDHARDVAAYADGVIVGSAVVKVVGEGDAAGAPERVAELVSSLRRGVERTRV
ncbi:MAG: tryptophan synthase subunit alpha [Nitriliruptorales bacterium]